MSDPVVNTTVFDHVVEVVFEEFDRFVFPAVGLGRHLVQVHFVQNDPIVVGTTLRGGIDFVWRTPRKRSSSALREPGRHQGAMDCWMEAEKEGNEKEGRERRGDSRHSEGDGWR